MGYFIKASKILPEHKVITKSDKSKDLCSGTLPSPSPSTSPSSSPSSFDDNIALYNQNKTSYSGLSTGGIIVIALLFTLVLLGLTGFTLIRSNPGKLLQQILLVKYGKLLFKIYF